MVNKYIGCGWIVALAAACSAASAAPSTGLAASGLSGTGLDSASGLATQFDSGSGLDDSLTQVRAASTAFTLDGQTAQAVADSSATADDTRRVQAFATSDTTAVSSAAALQLTLWNFVTNVRAQQSGNQFQSLEAASANIDHTINGVPAEVPLPPASWLFLGGFGMLAALQWRVRRDPRA